MRKKIMVKMARGGYMTVVAEGDVRSGYDSYDGPWIDIEVDLYWPHGGQIAEKNIADWSQVQETFYEAVVADDR